MGAAADLDTAAETPPMRKSVAKLAKFFSDGDGTNNTGEAVAEPTECCISFVVLDDMAPHCNPAFEY